MTVTASALIARALRLINATSSGETPTASEQADALTALNAMVDSWLTERLTIPQVLRTTKTLTASTQDYTIGVGGSINIDRPVWIDAAAIIPSGSTEELGISVMTDQDWQRTVIKSQTATFPLGVYYTYANAVGLGTVSLWPIPTTAPTLVLYTPKGTIVSFATLSTQYYVNAGYERALAYNLAVELADEFGKPIPAGIARIAMESLGNIKRSNIREVILGCDQGVLRRSESGGGLYDWRTDQGA